MDRAPREAIRLDERVGRTAHRAIVTERAQQSRNERRLAGTELALETDEPGPPIQVGDQRTTELGARRLRRLGRLKLAHHSSLPPIDAAAQLANHVACEQASLTGTRRAITRLGMHVNRRGRCERQIPALRGDAGDDAGQHVSHACYGHAGIAADRRSRASSIRDSTIEPAPFRTTVPP